MSTKKNSQESASGVSEKKGASAAPTLATVMYVGPPLRTPFPLATGTVFASGLPPMLQKATAADPALKALFLPLAKAGKAMRDLENGLDRQLAIHVKAVAAKQAAGRK